MTTEYAYIGLDGGTYRVLYPIEHIVAHRIDKRTISSLRENLTPRLGLVSTNRGDANLTLQPMISDMDDGDLVNVEVEWSDGYTLRCDFTAAELRGRTLAPLLSETLRRLGRDDILKTHLVDQGAVPAGDGATVVIDMRRLPPEDARALKIHEFVHKKPCSALFDLGAFSGFAADGAGDPCVVVLDYACECGNSWQRKWSFHAHDKCRNCRKDTKPLDAKILVPDEFRMLWEVMQLRNYFFFTRDVPITINPAITPEMIRDGKVFIGVYAMSENEDGSTLADSPEAADYFDVVIRPDDWSMTDGEPFAEWEYLSEARMQETLHEINRRHPGMSVDYICEGGSL